MLWDFHRRENERKPGSVHATYLLVGQRQTVTAPGDKTAPRRDGEDAVMGSSPPLPGSSMPMPDVGATVSQKTIVLVREEDLGRAKDTLEDITSIHVYSLEPQRLDDLQLLTQCTRNIAGTLRTDDLMQSGKQYGLIQNPAVRRRTRKTPLPAIKASAPAVKPAPFPQAASKTALATKGAAKAQAKPSLQRQGSSGIAASFAKGISKAKTDPKASSAAPSPAPVREDTDSAMGGMSDDEDDDDGDAADDTAAIDVKEPTGKSKKDRQAELEAMMDVEDEVGETLPEEPSAPVDQPAEVDEPKETATVENGRRRGRRKVMKKKTVRDEEGYLVTKEEAVWESFSEDEPIPKKAKTSAAAAVPAAKKASKPGKGNIMSFFGKK